MPVQANATMTFADYTVEDNGVRFHFVCPDPGPGEASDYFVFCTDAELSAVSTQVQLRNLLTTKLQRSIRRAGFASKLDQFIGQAITNV